MVQTISNSELDGIAIECNKDVAIFIPLSLIIDWKSSYGLNKLEATMPQIVSAINAVGLLPSEGQHYVPEIRRNFYHHISENDFFQSHLGKYVQCAVLVGREIRPAKFFQGSGTIWDEKSPARLEDIKCTEQKSGDGNPIVNVKVGYRGIPIMVTKSVSELLQLLY